MALSRIPSSPFEAAFARYAGAIPQTYLRSLAYKESGFRPDVVHPRSKATGLFQITKIALDDFNKRQGSRYTLEQLKEPTLNTGVAAHHLTAVIASYARYPALRPDWSSRRWVELLTLGWNAGHNAVIALASKLAASGIPPDRITVDSVSQLARATGTGTYVADPARVSWAKSVASMYLGGGAVPSGRSVGPLVATMLPGSEGAAGPVVLGVALLAAAYFGVSKLRKTPA